MNYSLLKCRPQSQFFLTPRNVKTPRVAVNFTRRRRIQGGLIPGTHVTKYYTPQETKSSQSMIHYIYILGPFIN